MQFPITLTFKILAIAPQIYAEDAAGRSVFYIRQKAFKLREHIQVFTDESRSMLLAEIGADRILDFNANYAITHPNGNRLGSISRRGMKSLWRASYQIQGEGGATYMVSEKSVFTRFIDGIVSDIPIVGPILTGYLFHPEYLVTDPSGALRYRVKKLPAFWEGRFMIERTPGAPEDDDILILLSAATMLLLERDRG